MIDKQKTRNIVTVVDEFIKELLKENKEFVDYKIVAMEGFMLINGIRMNGDEIVLDAIRTRLYEESK
jgi:hypothetical protein